MDLTGIGDDDLVAKLLEGARNPRALARGLEDRSGPWIPSESSFQGVSIGADRALFDGLPAAFSTQ
jgi:hypothetical protein